MGQGGEGVRGNGRLTTFAVWLDRPNDDGGWYLYEQRDQITGDL